MIKTLLIETTRVSAQYLEYATNDGSMALLYATYHQQFTIFKCNSSGFEIKDSQFSKECILFYLFLSDELGEFLSENPMILEWDEELTLYFFMKFGDIL